MKNFTLFSIFLSLSIFVVSNAFAQVNLELSGDDPDGFVIKIGDNTGTENIRLVTDDSSSGEGDSESDPITVYIPVISQGGTGGQETSFLHVDAGNLDAASDLPVISSTTVNMSLSIDLAVQNTTGSDRFVRFALQDDSNYYSMNLTNFTAVSGATTNATGTYQISIGGFCADQSSRCDKLLVDSSNIDEEINMFIYLDDSSDETRGDDVTSEVTNNTNGLFLKLKFNSEVPNNALTLNNLLPGDGRLFADYSNGASVTNMGDDGYRTIAFRGGLSCTSDPAVTTDMRIGDTAVFDNSQNDGVLRTDNYNEDGLLTIRPLTNGDTFNVGVVLVNKYQFTSEISICDTQTPQEIDALLEAQACYLITAGFQKEHVVLNLYRAFRDTFLLSHGNGQLFTILYYNTAPHFTDAIIKRPWLAALIRFLAMAGLVFIPMIIAVSIVAVLRGFRNAS